MHDIPAINPEIIFGKIFGVVANITLLLIVMGIPFLTKMTATILLLLSAKFVVNRDIRQENVTIVLISHISSLLLLTINKPSSPPIAETMIGMRTQVQHITLLTI